MSNELANIANNLPAHIQGDGAQAAAMVTSESHPKITLKDASFRIKKDGQEINVGLAKPIQVVILGIDPPEAKRTAKQFYMASWNADAAEAPDCYSRDGIVPDPSVPEPQATNCAQCPKNAWGSGHNEDGTPSKGKACSDRKNLLVVIAGKYIDGDVFQVSVPPTSLKALSKYGRELVQYNVNMNKIVTQIDIDPNNSKAMIFSYAGYLDEQASNRMAARAASPEIQDRIKPPMLAAPAAAQPASTPVQSQPSMANPAPAEPAELDLGALDAGSDAAPAVSQEVPQTQVPVKETPAAAGAALGTAQPATSEVDVNGTPWDARIHSANKSTLSNGEWRTKRGVDPVLVQQVMAEIAPNYGAAQTQKPAQQEAPPEAAAPADLDDLLSSWGDNT